jgi:hypothetical protein
MTPQEIDNKIIDLKTKNANINYVWMGLALAGGITGVVIASRKGKRFWGKVGGYFLGSLAVSIPVGIIAYPKMNKNRAEIKKLENEKSGMQIVQIPTTESTTIV